MTTLQLFLRKDTKIRKRGAGGKRGQFDFLSENWSQNGDKTAFPSVDKGRENFSGRRKVKKCYFLIKGRSVVCL